MPRRRRVLAVLAGLLASACSRPAAPLLRTPTPTLAPPPPTATPTVAPEPPTPVPPTPTATPLPPTPTATAVPTPSPVPTPAPESTLDVRLWNGTAEVQLDGQAIQPGRFSLDGQPHQLAMLVDGEPVAVVDAPAEGGLVDFFVPTPRAALAIMVENQADARPQSGLPQADVVYEILAEGGITRFVALYLSDDAPVVGPVRSLRHYFAFMAADYGADVVHIGASPEGFAWRDAMHLGKLDESAGDPGVWRVSARRPPHNAYTATAADRLYLAARGWQQSHAWGPLRLSADAPVGSARAETIAVGFRPWPYRVSYQWDADRERYLRFMEGSEHRDAETGEQIAPASVVVMFADVEPIPNDPKLRLEVDLVDADGPLLAFSRGSVRSGTWSKAGPTDATVWLDDEGQPLVLPPGQVWVEIVPLGSDVTAA